MAEKQDNSWLNSSLIQEILRNGGEDVIILSFDVTAGSGKGDGYLSNMIRCKVKYSLVREENVQEKSLIIKSLPTKESVKLYVSNISLFPNEIRVYHETLPLVYNELKRIDRYQKIAPTCYYCRSANSKMIVMEDLSVKGYKLGDRLKGLDLQHCLLVMKTIAKFHAGTAILHERDPKLIESYDSNMHTEEYTKHNTAHFFIKAAECLAEVAKSMFPNEKTFLERLKELGRTMRRDLSKSLIPNDVSFNCLIHGDLWLNNMMFRYDVATKSVKDVRFFDYQLSKHAAGAIDIQLFMNSSVPEDVLINDHETLLKAYHNELCETLNCLGYGGKIFSFQEFLKDYERYSLYGYFTTFYLLPIFMAQPGYFFEFDNFVNKIDDCEGHIKRLTNPLYTQILNRRLPIFAERGIF